MPAKRGKGDPLPTRKKDPVYDLIYARPGQPLDVTILSHFWTGIVTHWIPARCGQPARTVLCAECAKCSYCASHAVEQWNGYVGVVVNPTRRKAVLSLTDLGIRALEEAVPDNQEFRGSRVWVSRATSHPSSVVLVSLHEKRAPLPLPVPIDIWPTLRAVYGDDQASAVLARIDKQGGQ